jgi:tRNA threonylcarbamoyladenosine biosynthesis protein TsaE
MKPTAEAFHLPDAPSTERAGRALARKLAGGMVVALSGDLGAGKTTLARGTLRGLGWTGPVKSPTYALVEFYEFSSLYLYHFDFYRFADPREWETAGFAEHFRDDSVCLVEWPERVAQLLPVPDLSLALTHAGDGRAVAVSATTPAGKRCAHEIATAVTSP